MSKQQLEGIRFGFILILIWLIGLTLYLVCAKMDISERINKVIILPPPVESLDIIEGID